MTEIFGLLLIIFIALYFDKRDEVKRHKEEARKWRRRAYELGLKVLAEHPEREHPEVE